MEIITVTDGQMAENCYILAEGGKCVVIDPGLDFDAIKSKISNLKFQVKYILLTHGHYDHIHSLRFFTGIKVYAHAAEKRMLEDPSVNMSMYTGEPFSARNVEYYPGASHEMDGFRFIHAPGHTAGSVLISKGGVMFTGDTLFYDTIGRTDTPTGDPDMMKETLKIFNGVKTDTIIYPGHGDPFTLAESLKVNFFLRR